MAFCFGESQHIKKRRQQHTVSRTAAPLQLDSLVHGCYNGAI